MLSTYYPATIPLPYAIDYRAAWLIAGRTI
ncbi:hypothetical protein Nos7524_5404 [Nostoc sp. PCC 7524]|nr:hypothetical protein Nos7524_5404 [Nostoc sp. PCC 7524]